MHLYERIISQDCIHFIYHPYLLLSSLVMFFVSNGNEIWHPQTYNIHCSKRITISQEYFLVMRRLIEISL